MTDRVGLAQPTPEGKKQQAQVGSIEDAKRKGFEGVDLSYDVFGAPCSAIAPRQTLPSRLPLTCSVHTPMLCFPL